MKKTFEIGACGRACGACQFYRKKCEGCIAENELLESPCPVYICAKKKKTEHCLKCKTTIPGCKLMNSISKGYCLVVAAKRRRGEL